MSFTKLTGQPVIKGIFSLFVLVMLSACNDNQQAQADQADVGGDIKSSSLIFHSKTAANDEAVSTPLEITGIACDSDTDMVRTRIDLGEEGHVLVQDARRGSNPMWLVVIDLARLGIAGGKRENIYPERDNVTLALARNGDVTGHYQFQLHGELKGMYVVEMDIQC